VYANEGNLLGKNINIIRKNAKDLLAVSNKLNAEKIRNMFMFSY
jgi:ribosomal 30S subunit maturation factor RimM